jgi:predicted SnoaL-like aldol condensation-catalyzing enzyme
MSKTTQSSDLEKTSKLSETLSKTYWTDTTLQTADKYFPENPKQFIQFLGGFFQRFPDSRTTIDHILAEDDKVMVMITGNATDNQTGKRVTMKAADSYRIENGTIAEHWDVVDRSERV